MISKKENMHLTKVDYFLIAFGLLLVFLTVLFIINPDLGYIFSFNVWTGQDPNATKFTLASALIASGIACFLGALVPFPVPYTLVISVAAYQLWEDPELRVISFILIVLTATLLNLFGDSFDYVIGWGAAKLKEMADDNKVKDMDKNNADLSVANSSDNADSEANSDNISEKSASDNRWARIIYSKPKLIPVIIFLFGLTPLPDSLLLMPLGVVKYKFWKTMFWSGLGKLLMMLTVALAGVIGFEWLLDMLGGSGGSWWTGMVVLYISYIIVIVMVKSDKEK
ncbi:MAG: hypothetical protein ACTSU2_14095 [Promethearchaeota archaeon]